MTSIRSILPDVLQVPLSALFRCNRTNWCTFVVKNGTAQQQQVSIGQRSDLAAEIRQGLKPGAVVILHPTEQIKTGDRVNFISNKYTILVYVVSQAVCLASRSSRNLRSC